MIFLSLAIYIAPYNILTHKIDDIELSILRQTQAVENLKEEIGFPDTVNARKNIQAKKVVLDPVTDNNKITAPEDDI